jgi:hypothetical protein
MRGEKIYEYDLDVTGVADYGITLDAMLSGQQPIPPQGRMVHLTDAPKSVALPRKP